MYSSFYNPVPIKVGMLCKIILNPYLIENSVKATTQLLKLQNCIVFKSCINSFWIWCQQCVLKKLEEGRNNKSCTTWWNSNLWEVRLGQGSPHCSIVEQLKNNVSQGIIAIKYGEWLGSFGPQVALVVKLTSEAQEHLRKPVNMVCKWKYKNSMQNIYKQKQFCLLWARAHLKWHNTLSFHLCDSQIQKHR